MLAVLRPMTRTYAIALAMVAACWTANATQSTPVSVAVHRVPVRRRSCDAPCVNRTLTLTTGGRTTRTLFSPNFPRPYCADATCSWLISGPPAIRLRFAAANLDLRPDRDWILFFDGFDARNPSKNCTGPIRHCEFTSSGAQLAIRFVSGSGVQDSYGFQATVSMISANEITVSMPENAVSRLAVVEPLAKADDNSNASATVIFVLIFVTILALLSIGIVAYLRLTRSRQNYGKKSDNKLANTDNNKNNINRATLASREDYSILLTNS